MNYSKEEVQKYISDRSGHLKAIEESRIKELEEYRADIHYYIANSTITYTEAYSLMKEIYPNLLTFNTAMGRIRETILKRDRGENN